jgi:50S ribosomal protein L16 3-hydroxylase
VDLHNEAAHQLLQQFRFVPDARMDDLMISFATDQGGVGPHFDNYDVFLLQAHGKRRWRIGRQKDFTLQEGVPLKILTNFEPEEEWVLEPGDMLYLPPKWAHDGIAEGECMTYSVGFRSPKQDEMARELFCACPMPRRGAQGRGLQGPQAACRGQAGRNSCRPVRLCPGSAEKALAEPLALERALGEYMSDPKPGVWFEPAEDFGMIEGVELNRRTRMLYDAKHIFINGESYLAGGKDAKLMQQLADNRRLSVREVQQFSDDALELLSSWVDAGWAHSVPA